jgi:2-O-methyltransferase
MTDQHLFRRLERKIRSELKFFMRERLNLLEPKEGSILKNTIGQFLSSNPHIIDAGAHVGSDSIEFARLFPGAIIHAFEPAPAIYRKLVVNTRRWKRIHCYNLALSDVNGDKQFHLSGGASDASSSLLTPELHLVDHPEVMFTDRITVRCKTLDTWVADSKLSNIELLWLDLQGH